MRARRRGRKRREEQWRRGREGRFTASWKVSLVLITESNVLKTFHTLILRDPAAKKWSMSMTDEQRKEAMSSFLVGEVARYQERTPRREWSRLGMRLCC